MDTNTTGRLRKWTPHSKSNRLSRNNKRGWGDESMLLDTTATIVLRLKKIGCQLVVGQNGKIETNNERLKRTSTDKTIIHPPTAYFRSTKPAGMHTYACTGHMYEARALCIRTPPKKRGEDFNQSKLRSSEGVVGLIRAGVFYCVCTGAHHLICVPTARDPLHPADQPESVSLTIND